MPQGTRRRHDQGATSRWARARAWVAANRTKAAILGGSFATIAVLTATGPGANGRDPTLLERRETQYTQVSVYQRGDEVAMTFGTNARLFVESVADRKDPTRLPLDYSRYMTVTAAYVREPKRILEIGLGGGSTGWYMHKTYPGAQVTSVELDADVAQLATKWFGVHDEPGYRTVISDGRVFLRDEPGGWDIILVDAYRGTFVPYHLLTKEFYALARSKLAPGGALAQNVEPTTMMFDSAVRTMATAFPKIDIYRTGKDTDVNVVTVGWTADGATPETAQQWPDDNAKATDERTHPRYQLQAMTRTRRTLAASRGVDPNARVLEDDFAPVDALRAIEKHDRQWDPAAGQTR